MRALALASRGLERAGGDLGLSQYRVLLLVASSPDRASRLAERAQVSRPSLTGVLDGLEAMGYLHRVVVAGDRRGVSLELTDAGREALNAAERSMVDWLAGVSRAAAGEDGVDAITGLAALGRALACAHGRCRCPDHQDRGRGGPPAS